MLVFLGMSVFVLMVVLMLMPMLMLDFFRHPAILQTLETPLAQCVPGWNPRRGTLTTWSILTGRHLPEQILSDASPARSQRKILTKLARPLPGLGRGEVTYAWRADLRKLLKSAA